MDSVPGGSSENLGSGRARPGKKTGIFREEGGNAELIAIPGSTRRAAGLVAVINTLGTPLTPGRLSPCESSLWRIANDCILVDDFPLTFKNGIFSLRVNTPFSAVSFRPPISGRFSLNAQDWQETVLYYLLLHYHRDRYVLGASSYNILTDSLG